MFQILIVDDDRNTRRLLRRLLNGAGYTPCCASCAAEALRFIKENSFDLLIVDVTMPGMDGYTFTKLLRECRCDLPILMLSARGLPDDIRHGFLAGADDYMTKPADEAELLLRIRALLRRSRIASGHKLAVGGTTLDYDALSVCSSGHVSTLPLKEFLLLYKLLSCPNQIFTRIQLLDDIWGPSTESMEATVSVHINRLRKRFASNPDFRIVTIRGLGYKAQLNQVSQLNQAVLSPVTSGPGWQN
ncbi:MAG TPA: response regulator transcription factor [Candidatus Mediterraneibacter merdipullorum]|nr:response regulator transcription factor [Candidatus Mediterraneibacter merdipullorum]